MTRIPIIEAGIHDLYEKNDIRFPRSRWLYDRGFSAYVRLGQRMVDREMGVWLTIANMSATRLRQGYMREVFVFCEGFVDEHPVISGVYVESLQNAAIRPFLIGRGFRHLAYTDALQDGIHGDYARDR